MRLDGSTDHDLVAFVRGELSPDEHARLEAACAADPALRAAVAEIRAVCALVRGGTAIEPTPQERGRLAAAIDADLAARAAPAGRLVGLGTWVRDRWDYADFRLRRSPALRRFVAGSVIAHAAALAFVAVALVREDERPETRFAVEVPDDPPGLFDDDPLTGGDPPPPPFDAPGPREHGVILPQWDPGSPDGVPFPVPAATPPREVETRLRFPTINVALRYGSIFDRDDREERLTAQAGPDAAATRQAIARGLGWLSDRRSEDGTWAPDGTVDDGLRAGVTASAVLAFLTDGRSVLEGPDAELLAPSVQWLRGYLQRDPAAASGRPLHGYTLAMRAVAHHYFLDFRLLDRARRAELKAELAAAGSRLLAWQQHDGGFGYTPGDGRTDSSCTLFASAALLDLRVAGVIETRDALARAGAFLETRRRDDGILDYRLHRDRDGDLTLTAGLLALSRDLGATSGDARSLAAVTDAMARLEEPDALLAWSASEALHRHGAPTRAVLARVVKAQGADGRWAAATDRHCRTGGDALTTAMGVLSLTRAYRP